MRILAFYLLKTRELELAQINPEIELMTKTVSQDGANQLWKEHRTEADRLIRRLIASSKKPKAISHSVGGARHGWAMSLQDQIDFRALESLSNGRVHPIELKFVISHMIDESRNSVEDFELLFETDRVGLRQSLDRWTIMVPFYVEPDSRLAEWPSIRILGQVFRFRRWASIRRQIGLSRTDDVLLKSRIPRNVILPSVCLACAANGHRAPRRL